MIFGEKFHPMLKKMPPWRHSLFALVLATRSYSNFALWCEVRQVQGRTEFLNALRQCWTYHFDKFNHIDLEAAFEQVEPYLPMELEDYTEGDSFAFDVSVMLDVALSSVPMSSKNAQNASMASMASVIRYCEHNYPDQELDEDALLELEEIQGEMQFQIDLMYKVMEPRSEKNVQELLRFALAPEVSNIGLDIELSYEDFADCFVISARDSDADAGADGATSAGHPGESSDENVWGQLPARKKNAKASRNGTQGTSNEGSDSPESDAQYETADGVVITDGDDFADLDDLDDESDLTAAADTGASSDSNARGAHGHAVFTEGDALPDSDTDTKSPENTARASEHGHGPQRRERSGNRDSRHPGRRDGRDGARNGSRSGGGRRDERAGGRDGARKGGRDGRGRHGRGESHGQERNSYGREGSGPRHGRDRAGGDRQSLSPARRSTTVYGPYGSRTEN